MKIKSKGSKNDKNKRFDEKVSIRHGISLLAIEKLAPEISMASKVLRGVTIRGKIVDKVRKGREPWRYLIFNDKSYLPVKKEILLALVSATCEKKCLEIFRKQNKAGKLYIAMQCLFYRKEYTALLSQEPRADFDVDENRIQQLIKKEGNKEYKKVKTPSCRLCNLHFVYYFSQNKSKLNLEI